MLEIGLDKLGQWPILQFAAAILMFWAIGYVIVRGLRDKNVEPTHPREVHEQRWYFDGPVIQALNKLEGVYRLLDALVDLKKEEIAERRAQHVEHMKAVNELRDLLARRRR